jgi:hypothetical protein
MLVAWASACGGTSSDNAAAAGSEASSGAASETTNTPGTGSNESMSVVTGSNGSGTETGAASSAASDPDTGASETGQGGERGCPPYPEMPDETCTGVPPGVVLTPVDGDLEVTEPGAVVEGLDVEGCLYVLADNVTIRNTRVRGWCFSGAISTGYGEYSGTLIEDTEVDGTAPGTDEIAGVALVGVDNYTARRLDVHHGGRAFNLGSNVTVEDCYVHDMFGAGDSHNSGIGSNGGTDIVVRHNEIRCDIGQPGNPSTSDGGCSGALVLYSDFGPVSAIVEENRLNSSHGYCFLGYAHTTGSSLTVRNNQFGVAYNPDCGEYGPASRISGSAPFTWEHNVWYAPGEPIDGVPIPEPPDE